MTVSTAAHGLTREDLTWLAAFLDSHRQYEDEDEDRDFLGSMSDRIAATIDAMPHHTTPHHTTPH
jgi:hypothetical protein